MKFVKDLKHRSLSVIANCEYSEAGSKERDKRVRSKLKTIS
jgi:hypothetical protein